MTADKLYWLDIETTGLDEREDFILEVGFLVTDLDLEPIDKMHWTTGGPIPKILVERRMTSKHEKTRTDAEYVNKMHTDSGLWLDMQDSGLTTRHIEAEAIQWLKAQGIDSKTDPMCGSSVHFDRKFLAAYMPGVEKLFHYRNIDISTLKELARRWIPETFAKQEAELAEVENTPFHRVFSDVENTVNEARWYMDNFLWLAGER